MNNFFGGNWLGGLAIISDLIDLGSCGGLMVSADQAVRLQALAGDTVLCSWVRHFPLTVLPLPRFRKGYC